jgi:hypothetical protein
VGAENPVIAVDLVSQGRSSWPSGCATSSHSGTVSTRDTTIRLLRGAPHVRLACPARPVDREMARTSYWPSRWPGEVAVIKTTRVQTNARARSPGGDAHPACRCLSRNARLLIAEEYSAHEPGQLPIRQNSRFWVSATSGTLIVLGIPNGGYASARVTVLITGSCPCRPADWARPAPVICTARSRWTLAGGRLGRRDQPPRPRIAVLGCLEGVELGVLGRRVPSARRACLVG